jgi:hypothetical protein
LASDIFRLRFGACSNGLRALDREAAKSLFPSQAAKPTGPPPMIKPLAITAFTKTKPEP